MVTLPLLLAAALNLASTARAATTVSVRVVPPFPLERYAGSGAIGLLVPGSGSEVSREAALAALRTGRTRPSKLGGLPSGDDRLGPALGRTRADVTIYLSLPPPGTRPNGRRYPVAVVGGGYRGLLTSTRTRIPGLVSIADVAPTVEALEGRRDEAAIGSREEPAAPAKLRELDRRFEHLHGSRLWARIVLFTAALSLGAAALALRSRLLARAALLAPALVLGAAELLSALGESGAGVTGAVLVLAAVGAVPAARLPLAPLFALLLAAFAVLLAGWPDVAGLAALGPHPEGGGRFYGLTNSTETIVLAPALVAGAALGPLPLGLLALAVVAAGVDGGGLVVVFAGFVALALLLGRRAQAAAFAALGAAGAAAAALLGSNHLTDAAEGGPSRVARDLAHRWHLSYATVTSSPLTLVLFLGCLAALVALARATPRSPVLDALLVAIAVSLVFNDAPNDVIRFGAAAAATVWAWHRVSARPPSCDR